MATYWQAPEVKDIADDLIGTVDDHSGLKDVRIDYVFRDRAVRSQGRVTFGKARKVGGLNAYLAQSSAGIVDVEANGPFFVVEIAHDVWQHLDDGQRRALVDHELMHFVVDTDGALSLRGHDLEEFAAIVERHGLWASDVARFGSAVAEQLALAVEEVTSFVDGLYDEGE